MARIWIVDDDEANRLDLHQQLAGTGHELTDVQSGDAAIKLAAQGLPDLVLLDVMMPGLNGFETIRHLRQIASEQFLPIVLVTALNDPSSRALAFKVGADDFISRPVERIELVARVSRLLALRARDIGLSKRQVELMELHRFRDELSIMLVHDLKNPLSVILASMEFATSVLSEANVDKAVLEALGDSDLACRRMERLLANLLDVAKIEANKLQLRRAPTTIETLLSDVVQQRRLWARLREIEIELLVHTTATVRIDGDLVTRVLENILDNAVRYAPPKGRIVVIADPVDRGVRISIGNTGPAIPPDARLWVFEKHGQLVNQTGRMNLGLGLYFCRLVADAHGGRIWVDELEELPTVFRLYLPSDPANANAGA